MYNLSSPVLRRLRNYLAQFYRHTLRSYGISSYAQEGEDIILLELFRHRPTGFYVDIGAYHPRRFSNTYRFYRRGWRGINIDATPDSMRVFQRVRPRDINLEIAVSNNPADLTYYTFSEGALNTFDHELAQTRAQGLPIKAEIRVRAYRLADILEQHLPAQQAIDFMSVDVEGFDLDVLQSNDWQLYRPTCLLVESLDRGVRPGEPTPIGDFLAQQGYELIAHTLRTGIFQDERAKVFER